MSLSKKRKPCLVCGGTGSAGTASAGNRGEHGKAMYYDLPCAACRGTGKELSEDELGEDPGIRVLTPRF